MRANRRLYRPRLLQVTRQRVKQQAKCPDQAYILLMGAPSHQPLRTAQSQESLLCGTLVPSLYALVEVVCQVEAVVDAGDPDEHAYAAGRPGRETARQLGLLLLLLCLHKHSKVSVSISLEA